MHKVAILIGGGLGDCIWGYFNDDFNKKLLSVKKHYDLHVTCYVHSLNSQAIELVRYNPNINEIIFEKYMQPVDRKVVGLNYIFDLSIFEDLPMPIYLTEEEIDFCQKIKNSGEYIVLHPFAGEKDRKFTEYVPEIVKTLSDHKIIIIGGDHIRRESEHISESIDFDYKNVTNLVNKVSVRVCCELVKNCKFFIGSHSCFLSATWVFGTPALCIVPDHFMSYLLPDKNSLTKPQYPNIDKIFKQKSGLMFFSQIPYLKRFMEHFLLDSDFTALRGNDKIRRSFVTISNSRKKE